MKKFKVTAVYQSETKTAIVESNYRLGAVSKFRKLLAKRKTPHNLHDWKITAEEIK